jgi:hypothetical protein
MVHAQIRAGVGVVRIVGRAAVAVDVDADRIVVPRVADDFGDRVAGAGDLDRGPEVPGDRVAGIAAATDDLPAAARRHPVAVSDARRRSAPRRPG